MTMRKRWSTVCVDWDEYVRALKFEAENYGRQGYVNDCMDVKTRVLTEWVHAANDFTMQRNGSKGVRGGRWWSTELKSMRVLVWKERKQ